jgi:hypothetical protein
MRLNLPFLLLEEVLSGAWRQVWGQLGEMGDTAKLGMNVRMPCPVGTDRGDGRIVTSVKGRTTGLKPGL